MLVSREPQADKLRVNPIACTGHGICAELLPELITLDPWGYPIMPADPLPEELTGLAKKAVADCPTLALFISRRKN